MYPTILTVNPMRRRSHRRHNPHRRHRRRNPESTRMRRKAARAGWRHRRHANPLRRRHRAHNAFRRRRSHRRHNPLQKSGNEIVAMLVPAGIGAVSAVGLDIIMAYLPLPAAVATGWGNILTKAAGAIGLGFLAGMVAGRKNGVLVGAGALTVVGYEAVRAALAPTLGTTIKGLSGLADFGDYTGAYMAPGQQVGVGAYMNPGSYVALPPAAAPSTGLPPNAAPSLRQKQMAGMGGLGAWRSR